MFNHGDKVKRIGPDVEHEGMFKGHEYIVDKAEIGQLYLLGSIWCYDANKFELVAAAQSNSVPQQQQQGLGQQQQMPQGWQGHQGGLSQGPGGVGGQQGYAYPPHPSQLPLSTPQFKVGDMVECIWGCNGHITKGKVYEVVALFPTSSGRPALRLRFNDVGRVNDEWYADNFKLATVASQQPSMVGLSAIVDKVQTEYNAKYSPKSGCEVVLNTMLGEGHHFRYCRTHKIEVTPGCSCG